MRALNDPRLPHSYTQYRKGPTIRASGGHCWGINPPSSLPLFLTFIDLAATLVPLHSLIPPQSYLLEPIFLFPHSTSHALNSRIGHFIPLVEMGIVSYVTRRNYLRLIPPIPQVPVSGLHLCRGSQCWEVERFKIALRANGLPWQSITCAVRAVRRYNEIWTPEVYIRVATKGAI